MQIRNPNIIDNKTPERVQNLARNKFQKLATILLITCFTLSFIDVRLTTDTAKTRRNEILKMYYIQFQQWLHNTSEGTESLRMRDGTLTSPGGKRRLAKTCTCNLNAIRENKYMLP